MEFKDRQASYPGRVTLRNVSTGATATYDVTMADGAGEQGTPLNKQTFDSFKEDVLNQVQAKYNATFVLSGTTLTIII